MKKLLIITGLAVVAASCSQKAEEKKETATTIEQAAPAVDTLYGDTFELTGALPVDSIWGMKQDTAGVDIKVEGEIDAVCQMAGCWMNLKTAKAPIRVRNGEKFEFPKDGKGKRAIVVGKLKWITTTVDELKEYAKDDGKSKAEIDAIKDPITEPEIQVTGAAILK